MDPDVTLAELRDIVAAFRLAHALGDLKGAVSVAAEAFDKFEDLDDWMRRGARPPAEWSKYRANPMLHHD